MKKLLSSLLIAIAGSAFAGAPTNLVTITCTNALGQPDTNVIKVFSISTPINADGTYFITGTAFRVIPNTNGIGTITNLMPGAYAATNPGLGSIVFAIPNLAGAYNAAQPGIALSGANKYNYSPGVISLTSTNGTVQISPSNGIGVVDLSVIGAHATNSDFAYFVGDIHTNQISYAQITNPPTVVNSVVVPGQSTSIRTNSGPAYAVDVTGQLTNSTTGNALTATKSSFADDVSTNKLPYTSISNSPWATTSTTITIAGTANQISSSAGAQDLSANRTWTLSTPSAFIAPGTVAAVSGITNQSFTSSGVVTNDSNGKLYSVTSIQNGLLANSSLTVSGTANQISVSGGNPVSLGGTVTLSLPSPAIAPGQFAAAGITNQASAGSRLQYTTTGGKLIDATASGAVPINADSTASTSAQVNSLFPGSIHTNGMSIAATVSNTFAVDFTHAFYGNGSGLTNIPLSAITNTTPRSIVFSMDGMGNVVPSGTTRYMEIPYACTVKAGTLISDVVGSIQVEAWRTNAGNRNLISRAGSLGTNWLTNTNWSKDYALSGWSSTTISSNDILAFVVTTNAASCTQVTLQLQVQP